MRVEGAKGVCGCIQPLLLPKTMELTGAGDALPPADEGEAAAGEAAGAGAGADAGLVIACLNARTQRSHSESEANV